MEMKGKDGNASQKNKVVSSFNLVIVWAYKDREDAEMEHTDVMRSVLNLWIDYIAS